MPGICSALTSLAAETGKVINLENAKSTLLIIHEDHSAELWVDTAAVSLTVVYKKLFVESGQPVFDNDIADVIGVRFPAISIKSTDRILYLFRNSWRFGLYFDLRENINLDVQVLEKEIAALHRNLAFRHLYDAASNPKMMQILMEAGWFPFSDIINDHFENLATSFRRNSGIETCEAIISAAYNAERVDHILARWLSHPVFLKKELVLTSAINAFKNEDYVSAVTVLLTQIEGILNAAHWEVRGSGANMPNLLKFARSTAENKVGNNNTILLTKSFEKYLNDSTFGQSDGRDRFGKSGSRHSVSHGNASDDAYSRVRAIQAILTMDQLAFFI